MDGSCETSLVVRKFIKINIWLIKYWAIGVSHQTKTLDFTPNYQIWFVNQKHCLHNVILLKKGSIYDKSTQEIKEVA